MLRQFRKCYSLYFLGGGGGITDATLIAPCNPKYDLDASVRITASRVLGFKGLGFEGLALRCRFRCFVGQLRLFASMASVSQSPNS